MNTGLVPNDTPQENNPSVEPTERKETPDQGKTSKKNIINNNSKLTTQFIKSSVNIDIKIDEESCKKQLEIFKSLIENASPELKEEIKKYISENKK